MFAQEHIGEAWVQKGAKGMRESYLDGMLLELTFERGANEDLRRGYSEKRE